MGEGMMDAEGNRFKVVLRGYEPGEVDRRTRELTESAQAARQQAEALSLRVRELEEVHAELAQAAAERGAVTSGSFAELGERIGQMLSLAEEEAVEIRAAAKGDAEAQQQQAEEAAGLVHGEADRYAKQLRGSAEADAAQMLEEARRKSDELLDEADRSATARVQEAEALFESQRAKTGQAAADFETTLAERRARAEQEFSEQFETSQRTSAEVQDHIERTRADAEKLRSDAELNARRMIEDAQQKAAEIVAQGRAHVDRIRVESDRELAAATQRRDSINAQLTNVRQMLATLSGAAPAGPIGLGLGLEEPAEAPSAQQDELQSDPDDVSVEDPEKAPADEGEPSAD